MPPGDRVSSYLIGIESDPADVLASFGKITSGFRSAVSDLKSASDKLDLFSTITDNVPKVQAALDKAKAQVTAFAAEIDKLKGTGKKPTQDLVDGLAQAEKAAKSAGIELANQQQKLAALGFQLQKAGVDTGNLAAEQGRLALASKAAAEAAAVMAAKQSLGLTTVKDTTAEAAKLRAAFDTLKTSGTLSATETAAAQTLLNAKIKELNASVTTTTGSFKAAAVETKDLYSGLALKVTGAVAAFTAVGGALSHVTEAAKEYNQRIAEVGTVTSLSKQQLGELGAGARALAVDIGANLNDVLKGLYELLRAGVPSDNALEVLRLAAEAAKASFTDIGSGISAAKLLLNDFKIPVNDLAQAFDVLAVSQHKGGVTLAEFAAQAGPLLGVAKQASVGFEELNAVLIVLRKGGLDAGDAMSALTKIITALGTDKARLALLNLGIDSTNLVEIFTQLGQKGVSVQAVLDLTGVSRKSVAAIANLIGGSGQLKTALDQVAHASGEVERASIQLYDTAEERGKRLAAAFHETEVQIGQAVGAGGKLSVVLTLLLNGYNELGKAARESGDKLAHSFDGGVSGAQQFKNVLVSLATTGPLDALLNVAGAVLKAKAAMDAIKPTATTYRNDLVDQRREEEAAAAAVDGVIKNIELYAKALTAITPEIEKATQEQIASIKEQAATEISLLDQGINARLATAAKTVEIQNKESTDILAVIKQSGLDIQAIAKATDDARTALEVQRVIRGQGNERQYVADIREIHLKADAAELANYRKLQQDLIGEKKAAAAALNAIDQARVSFNETINKAIVTLNLDGLQGLAQYEAKQKEIDRLIAEGRDKAATQGIAAGEKYFNEALTLSQSLKGEVLSDETVVKSAFQAQQDQLNNLKKIRAEYNTAADTARAKEKQDYDTLDGKLKTVGETITGLQKEVDGLRDAAQRAIQLTIADDIIGYDKAKEKLRDLAKDYTVNLRVNTSSGPSAPGEYPPSVPGFAGGGPVFRRPAWSKVPGSGSGDTVPALLESGSFVMRRAAVQKYGDGIMSRLARGYADGGYVSGLIFGNIPANKKTDAEKLAEYINSLPRAEQQRFKQEVELGGTSALIAEGQAREAIATQARGAPVPIAPGDISPTPSADDAVAYGRSIEAVLKFGGIMDLVKKQIGTYINQVQRSPFDQSLIQGLVRSARAAAANNWLENVYGKSVFGGEKTGAANLPDWFDFIAQLHQAGNPNSPYHGVDFRNIKFGYAGGGRVDTIPAMLTPGEVVLNPSAVQSALRMFGGGFLDAMNAGRLNFAPPPMPRHYAMGGPVGDVPGWNRGGTAAVGGGNTFHVTIQTPFPADDPKTLRRVQAGLDKLNARSGKKLVRA